MDQVDFQNAVPKISSVKQLPEADIAHGSNPERLMSALGHKQTLERVRVMSALPPKADICSAQKELNRREHCALRHRHRLANEYA